MNIILVSKISLKNFMTLTALLCIIYPFNAFSRGTRLIAEFLTKNKEIKTGAFNIKKDRYNYDIFEGRRDWQLGASLSGDYKRDLYTPSARGIFPLEQKTHLLSASISKMTDWGGYFSVSQGLYQFLPPDQHMTQNSISYTQDLGINFLGRKLKGQREVILLNTDWLKSRIDEQTENLLFKFYLGYLKSRLYQTLISLQQNAVKRAIKREKVIKERVSDGLALKIDLIETRMATVSQKETELVARKDFEQSMDDLSSDLHRKIMFSEVHPIYLQKKYLLPNSRLKIDKNKKVIQKIKNMKLLKKNLSLAEYDLFPKMSLTTQIISNKLHDKRVNSLVPTLQRNKNNEIKMAVNLSIPLGYNTELAQKRKYEIELKSLEYNLKHEKINIKNNYYHLLTNMIHLKKLLESANLKRIMALKALRENNKLYELGKREIDFIIKSEENLIATERTLAQYHFNFLVEKASFYLIQGELKNYLLEGQDE